MPQISPADFDLVLTLGDISEGVLDYILFMARQVPVYGVPGNHDPCDIPGLSSLHRKVIDFKGIRIGGFGGAKKYKEAPYNFTDREVSGLIRRMPMADLFISHAPPLLTSQAEDRVHKGFRAFDNYIRMHGPRYWIHGHLGKRTRATIDHTTVIGICEREPLILEF